MPTYVTNSDGSLTWTGSVTFSGANDPLTYGVATLTLLPSGGVSNLPALVQGDPGLSPTLRNVNMTQVAYGTTAPASTWTLVTPGTSTVAPVYDLNLYVNSGQIGATGSSTNISSAPDVEGGPPGSGTDGYTLYWVNADSKWKISPAKRTAYPFTVLNSSFSAAYNGNAGQYIVASVGVPAQPYAWRPKVHAAMYATGTVNTHVDLVARLNNATTGDQVGYGLGSTGVGPYPIVLQSAFGASVAGTSTYGQVAAGSSATIFLVAQQTASTTDNWQTLNTNAYFTVEAVPS
jgi:hypothetical protein